MTHRHERGDLEPRAAVGPRRHTEDLEHLCRVDADHRRQRRAQPERPGGDAEVLHRGIHARVEPTDVHVADRVVGPPRNDRLQEQHQRRRLADVIGKMAARIAGAPPRRRLGLVVERRRFGKRPLVPLVRSLVQRSDPQLRRRVGHHNVLLGLHVAAARSLLGGAQARLQILVADRSVAEAPDRSGRHDRFDRVHVIFLRRWPCASREARRSLRRDREKESMGSRVRSRGRSR